MKNMNQGDLYKLIIELNFAKQVDIADAIIKFSGLRYEDNKTLQSNISRAIKGQSGKPLKNMICDYCNVISFASNLFPVLFSSCDLESGISQLIVQENFESVKTYLKSNELSFPNMELLENENADCKTFIVQMMAEALKQHKPHPKETSLETNDSRVLQSDEIQSPILHPQTIFCPNHFFSRDTFLDNISNLLKTYKLAILYGIGGIGKTYLSRQYAHIHSSQYTTEQIVTLEKNSASFKKAILSLQFDGLIESEMDDNDKLEKRINLLKNMNEDTLLIIDNVDSYPEDLQLFDDLRINSGIHIIITTRLKDCFSNDQTIHVTPMKPDEQLLFFKSHYKDILYKSDIPIISKILEYIDGHTLLIELVAKSMHSGAMSAMEMLRYLKGEDDTELVPVSISKDNLTSEKKTMSDFIKLLFDIGYLDNKAKEALLYLSILPVEGVNRRLFYNLLPSYKNTFNELIEYSWAIEDSRKTIIRLHPVIRDMIRKELFPSINNCNIVMTNLHSMLQTTQTTISSNDKNDICKILSSVCEINDFFINCNNVTLLTFLASFCFNTYDFNTALKLYIVASKIAENSPVQTVTDIYIKIGDVYKRLAFYEESILHYEKALKSNKRLQDCVEKNLQEADIYEHLSDIYRKDSRYEQAMKYNDFAINIYETKSNQTSPKQLAEIYNRRGIIFLNRASDKTTVETERANFLKEALVFYQKALKLRIESNDTNRQLAYSYHNVGTAYNKLNEYSLALENHKKALDLRLYDQESPNTDVASSYVWVGNDYMAMGEEFWDIARENFEKSLEIREKLLGVNHPEVAWSLMSLSELYEKQGEIEKSLIYAQRAYNIRIGKFSPSHNYVIQVSEWIQKLNTQK